MAIAGVIEALKIQSGLALAKSIAEADESSLTEISLANLWLDNLRKDDQLYEDGWYSPPPHGVIALCGDKNDRYQRICSPSFRPAEFWPRDDIVIGHDSIVAAYASPVQKKSNLIGDFGLTLYSGDNPEIWQHFERVLATTIRIANCTEVGMPLQEVYRLAMLEGRNEAFMNNIESSSDITGTNIGHTIPLSYPQDETHAAIRVAGNFSEISQALSRGRKFINQTEAQPIEPDFALTIEPRFSTSSMPNTWFHLTVIFENGRRRICHGFSPVFEQFQMTRLTKLLP